MSVLGGIDLGGTKIQAIVFDPDGERTLGQARHPTPQGGGPQAVIALIAQAMREAASAAGMQTSELAGIGMGSPGEIDAATASVAHASNLPDWDDPYPVGAVLAEQLGTPVVLGNDVDVATQAEFALGAGREFDSLLGVFWGTGVGGGLVIDGQPLHGRGGAGEIGHMVVKIDGARCPCGRRGCMEAYAGRRAMEMRARREVRDGRKTVLFEIMHERGRTALSSGVWARALEQDDRLAHELVERAVAALGAGVASAVNLLDVELVVIGGGLGTRFGEPMRARIEQAMMPHLFFDERPPVVRLATLGDLGGAIGAALLVDGSETSSEQAA